MSTKAQAFFDVRINRMSAPGNERRAEVGRELGMRIFWMAAAKRRAAVRGVLSIVASWPTCDSRLLRPAGHSCHFSAARTTSCAASALSY